MFLSGGYSLTDFKESVFFANRFFERTGEKQQAVLNVSTNKLHLSAALRRRSGKSLRSLEKVITMSLQKHCDDFIKASYSPSGSIEKKNLTVREQSEKQF
jgi:hypothetical protein